MSDRGKRPLINASRRRAFAWGTAFSLAVLAVPSARAATMVWGGGNGTFSTAANWVGGSAPASDDTVLFGGWAPLSRTSFTVSASLGSNPSYAKDGDRDTQWTANTGQASGQYVIVNLGSSQTFRHITMDSTITSTDYPRAFDIYVSTNGSTWGSPITSGTGSSSLVTVTLPANETKQYIKIQLTGSSGNWWRIGELWVYGVSATELSRSGWSTNASASGGGASSNAIDGDETTKWSPGVVQASGQWFSVDMGSARTFTRIDMDANPQPTDYPRGYDVYVSDNGSTWGSPIASQNPSTAYTSITFSSQTKRYIKVQLDTGHASYWWALFEFKVYGTPANCTISSNASVTSMSLENSVTVTQSSGATLTTSGSFSQSAGTFTGGNSNITVGGSFDLSGGTFTSTSALLKTVGAFNKTGGTFTHNSGRVMLAGLADQTFSPNNATFNNLIINDGLVGYWRLDEGSGTNAADSSGYNNNGTVSGAGVTWQSSVPGTSFRDPYSIALNGSTGSVSLPSTNLPVNNAAQTISLWAKLNSTSGNQNLISLSNGSNSGVQLKVVGGSLGAYAWGGSTYVATTAPSTGVWHHIAYTYNGSSGQTLYIDGVATTATVANQTATPTVAYLGTYSPNNEMYNGSLDDVRIYSRALSATEITSLYIGNQAGTSISTQTMSGAATVASDLTIASGGLYLSTNNLTVAGDWWNFGGMFWADYWTGVTLTLTGSSQTNYIRSAGMVLPSINITGTGKWTLEDDLDLDPSSGITFTSGSMDILSRTLRVGDLNSGSGTLTASSGTVVLNANANQTVNVSGYNVLRVEDPSETNMVRYWKLDEGQAVSARDWTGSGSTGTLAGGAEWTASVPGTSRIEYHDPHAVSFDGSTGYMSAWSAATPSNAAFTACAWVKHTSVSATQTLVSIDGNNISGFFLKKNNASPPKFALEIYASDSTGAAGYFANGTTTVATGTWYHVCGVYTGSVSRIYVNGAQEGSDTAVSGSFNATGNTIIGAGKWSSRTNYVNGAIDDVRIYSVALSAAQIRALGAGRYAGTGGTATVTLGANMTATSTFAIDSGGLNTSSYTFGTATSDATKVAYVGAGTLTVGSSTATFNGGLNVRNEGTLALDTASGTVSIGTSGLSKTLTIDGTLSASTTSATIKATSASYPLAFTVGSSSTATPTIDVSGLSVQNTDANGMYINANASSVTTFTQFDNVFWSSGSATAGAPFLQIYATSLALVTSGHKFAFAAGNPDYAVELAGNGSGGGDTRAIFGGAICPTTLCTTSHKLDDDSDNDGVGDTGNGTGNEAVLQFVRAAPSDLAGTIQGFPTAAFNWNDFTYWRTYVAYNNASGAVDRVYVRNSDGSPASGSYYWDLPSSVGEIIGTPRWTMVGATHYVYVATTLGRVYRLIDNGTSLATDSTPWNTPYFHGGSATISTPLAIDDTNIYWMGTDSSGNRKFFILTHAKALTSGATSLPAGVVTDPTAAPALSTISSSDYLFAGMKGYISKLKVSDQALTNWTQPVSAAINGRLSIGSGLVYAGDNLGKVFGVNASTLATDWCYQDTTTHGSCTDGGNCTIQNIYVDLTNNYIMYGDQDGHFYVVSKSSGGTSCTGASGAKLSGYPVQPAAGEAITTAPLFDNGIVFFGTSSGNVFVYNRRTVAGGTPALLRTYKLGSAVSSIGFNANTNSSAGAYMVGTANGKLFFIDKVSDGDAYK